MSKMKKIKYYEVNIKTKNGLTLESWRNKVPIISLYGKNNFLC